MTFYVLILFKLLFFGLGVEDQKQFLKRRLRLFIWLLDMKVYYLDMGVFMFNLMLQYSTFPVRALLSAKSKSHFLNRLVFVELNWRNLKGLSEYTKQYFFPTFLHLYFCTFSSSSFLIYQILNKYN